jgi:hypothetical protein
MILMKTKQDNPERIQCMTGRVALGIPVPEMGCNGFGRAMARFLPVTAT